MIHGWNFTGKDIPSNVRKRFRQELPKRQGRLQGVCNDETEKTIMTIQASNGHRKLHWVGPRKIEGQMWYAVYCW